MKVTAEKIANSFDLKIFGNKNYVVDNVGSLKRRNETSFLWAKRLSNLTEISEGVVVCNINDFDKIKPQKKVCYLVTNKSQRLIFAQVITKFFSNENEDIFTNYVEEHRKNKKLKIGENVFIAKNVSIGDGTIIHPNVVIYSNTKIGKNCVLKTHVSLGTEGLGLEMNPETGTYFKFPQIGGVVLEDNIEIGPTATVRRSALDDTIIQSGTMIGSLVNIGHNCIVGENCILTCQIVLSGSSKIGNEVFMGVNSIVKQGVHIGDKAVIGQGAVVTKNVPGGETWIGNPARLHKNNK